MFTDRQLWLIFQFYMIDSFKTFSISPHWKRDHQERLNLTFTLYDLDGDGMLCLDKIRMDMFRTDGVQWFPWGRQKVEDLVVNVDTVNQ